jgi:hypothetical protein
MTEMALLQKQKEKKNQLLLSSRCFSLIIRTGSLEEREEKRSMHIIINCSVRLAFQLRHLNPQTKTTGRRGGRELGSSSGERRRNPASSPLLRRGP